MGNGVSGDQGNLPSHGTRDVGATFDRKQHDWSEQGRAQEVNTLSSNPNSYNNNNNRTLIPSYPATRSLQLVIDHKPGKLQLLSNKLIKGDFDVIDRGFEAYIKRASDWRIRSWKVNLDQRFRQLLHVRVSAASSVLWRMLSYSVHF